MLALKKMDKGSKKQKVGAGKVREMFIQNIHATATQNPVSMSNYSDNM